MSSSQRQTARDCAVEILRQHQQRPRPITPIITDCLKKCVLATNDRALSMQLVYGTLRRRQSLQRILSLVSKIPAKRIQPVVYQILLVALYQIFYLDRIPSHAVVFEAVESCKRARLPRHLQGFVNGILRQSIRDKASLYAAATYDEHGEEIVNHPQWLIKRWQSRFGKSTTSNICQANNRQPALCLCVNTTKIDRQSFLDLLIDSGLSAQTGNYAPKAVVIEDFNGSPEGLPGYRRGFFQVQDEAAQLASEILAPFAEGGAYLDACAGLGGKTANILQATAAINCRVQAVEPEPFRFVKLQENLTRLFNAPQLTLSNTTLKGLKAGQQPPFDGILVDAPCSGTGVIRRHPDIKWNRKEGDLAGYQRQQYELLQHAAALLKNGGIMVYATCSIEAEENQQLIDRFLVNNSEFNLQHCENHLPEEAQGLVQEGFFSPLPTTRIDGFFAARLQKND